MSDFIKRSYPDNWPWSLPHQHPEGDTPPPFEGFNPDVPESGTAVSNLAQALREAKVAYNSVVSVPTVFSCDVEDGDIVIPLPCGDSCDVNCDELLKTLRDLGQIPDAIWVPAFRTSTDSQVSTLSAVDPTTYDPPFYGVAYTKLKRVMVGPVVAHPRFKFHTGDKIYAGEDGDLTTTTNEHMVGVCLAPGAIFLSQYASVLKEAMKDLYDEATQDAEDNTIEKIEQEGLDGDNIKVTTDGATTERPLELHLGDIVNVKDFGAKGDGVTNDTNAFNAAIAHMQELGSNVCLFIPPGDYLVTELPNVPCYGPGSIKHNSYTYSPFELLFKLNGAIQKDTNGRFKVDFTKMSEADLAALIKQLLPSTGGGLTTDEDGKLVVDFTQMSEEELREMIESLLPSTGGGLTTDEDGKLVLDFSQLTPTQKEDLISQIVQEGGGLSVDENGQLYVDFDSMPTDKFEAMRKSIRVPIWLEANKAFYVNGSTGSDTLDAGRGESASKPFRTIQTCINYITDNYNMSRYVATIYCKDVVTTSQVTLPNFSRTTGRIDITKSSDCISDYGLEINYAPTESSFALSCVGGDYRLNHIKIDVTDENYVSGSSHWGAVVIDSYLASVNFYNNIHITAHRTKSATFAGAWALYVASGRVYIGSGCTIIGDALESLPLYGINVVGEMRYDDPSNVNLVISGSFGSGGIISISGRFSINGVYMRNIDTSGVSQTTYKYRIIEGGWCNVRGKGPDFFGSLGTEYVESDTYSWYK